MREPTPKDCAEYFRLTLEVGLCRELEIETWVDNMIIACKTETPAWLLNLSIDGEISKAKLLSAVPGEADEVTVWSLVLAKLRKANQLGRISREQVTRVLFRWAVNREIPKPFFNEAYRLDDGFDGIKEGRYSEAQFVEDFEKFFKQFQSVEALLPEAGLQASQ